MAVVQVLKYITVKKCKVSDENGCCLR